MERFVFVTAITLALIYGAWRLWGVPSFSFADDDFGRHGTEAVMPVAAGHSSQSYNAQGIAVRHAAARLQIIPEDRQDYVIEITNPGSTPMPSVEMDGDTVVIDGHVRGRVKDCHDDGGARIDGYGDFQMAQLPQIVVHTPREVQVEASGAVRTEIGASRSVKGEFRGCGDAQIADVTGLLELETAGTGNITAGAAQGLEVEMAGTGQVTAGAVTDHAKIATRGTGDVSIASLTGALDGTAAGTGSMTVAGGAISTASLEIFGTGNAHIAAPIQRLEAQIMGPGDVNVTAAVGDLDAEVYGPGSVSVASVTGSVQREVRGPGRVTVGGR